MGVGRGGGGGGCGGCGGGDGVATITIMSPIIFSFLKDVGAFQDSL